MVDETIQQARERWHSDDPIVCLRRALAEVALFESIEKARKEGKSPEIDRVIAGIEHLSRIAEAAGVEHLSRIAEAVERIANKLAPPRLPRRIDPLTIHTYPIADDDDGEDDNDDPTNEEH